MDIESKVWNLTKTGFRYHAFRDGVALCRPNIRHHGGEAEDLTRDGARKHIRESHGLTLCEDCCYREDFYAWSETPADETPDNSKKESEPMGYDQRKRTGPLSPGQKKILDGLTAGQRQSEIAKEMGASRSYISAEARVAAARMGVETTNAVCARWGTALAYLDAADLIERDANYNGEDAVAAVLHELVKILRSRAAALIPS